MAREHLSGDPIEVQAANEVLSKGRDPDSPLLVGSVKTNIGHTESAAGVASIMKVVLALQHETLPKSLHFSEPNPHIPWDRLNVKVVSRGRCRGPRGGGRRIAGVSSFGFVGTNAHVVMEEAPTRGALVEEERDRAARTRRPRAGVVGTLGTDALTMLARYATPTCSPGTPSMSSRI